VRTCWCFLLWSLARHAACAAASASPSSCPMCCLGMLSNTQSRPLLSSCHRTSRGGSVGSILTPLLRGTVAPALLPVLCVEREVVVVLSTMPTLADNDLEPWQGNLAALVVRSMSATGRISAGCHSERVRRCFCLRHLKQSMQATSPTAPSTKSPMPEIKTAASPPPTPPVRSSPSPMASVLGLADNGATVVGVGDGDGGGGGGGDEGGTDGELRASTTSGAMTNVTGMLSCAVADAASWIWASL